jgi:hypothetical protein
MPEVPGLPPLGHLALGDGDVGHKSKCGGFAA